MLNKTIAIAALATAVAVAGCTSSRQAGNAPARFQIAQQREPLSLNPALENGASSTEWGFLLFSYLVKYDENGNLIGDVATQVPTLQNGGIARDGLTVTYHLRKGVRFADGVPLTAHDCVWTINAINNSANNVQSRYGYDRIAKAEAPNDYTLVLHLKHPFAPLLTLVLAPQGFPILPQHLLAKYPDFNHIPFDQKPLGSGPYVVDRWIHGDRVVMHANPLYFRGKPSIEHITIRFVPDSQAALNMLQAHEIQGYYNEQDYSQYPQLVALKGYRTAARPVAGVGAIIFNTQDPATADPRVRHALAQAIDIKSIVTKAYRGAVSGSQAARGLFFWAYDAKAYPDIAYDPAQANRMLDAAGWKMGADGIRRKDGMPLDLQMIIQAGTPAEAVVGNSVTQYERAVGAHVTLKQFNVTQFVAPAGEGGPVYGGKFNLALYPFVNGDDPDTTDQFACSNVPPHGYNKSRICDPRIDALLRQGQQTFDIGKRKAIYARLQRVLQQELPIVLLYSRNEVDVFTDRLRGQSVSLDGTWWNVGAWHLAR